MKKSILLLLALLVISNAFSQLILTYNNNAPLNGDTIYTEEIDLISPGNAGANQIWDFSKIQMIGDENESFLSEEPVRHIEGLKDFNSILNDKGYEYFYKMDKNSSEIVGLVSKDLSIVFSDPVIKMKYPLVFGTRFTDEFNGTGVTNYKSGIAVSGNYSLEADAYGTMILNDRIIKDVLRVKIEEKKIQINPCSIYEIKTTNYFWYAPAARYPVIGLSTREVKSGGQDPVITHTAFINHKMSNSGILFASSDQGGINTDEVSLILYPNPFVTKLGYNYFLRKQVPVTIELVDMTGKTVISVINGEVQSQGFHSGELDATIYDLKMGVYNFRCKFGEKVFVSKIVKM